MKKRFLALLFFLISTHNLFSQELITDRPDFTESANAVPWRTVQVETGIEYGTFNSTSTLSYPIVLTRFGLGKQLEVRFGFSGWHQVSVNNQSETFLNDVLIESKYQLTAETANIPMAILLVSTLPTGDEEVSAGDAEIGLKYACSYDINESLSVGANIGAITALRDSDNEMVSLASIAMGMGITKKTSAFLEVFAEIPEQTAWEPVVDGGLTYLITPLAQADVYVGKGLNKHADNWIVGLGFSFQFNY